MNCRNCAAPMELFERRRYYFCRYCGTFEFIEGSAGDGIQVLRRRGDGAPCPLCAAPLAQSLLDYAHCVQYCEKCRGILIERPTFALAVPTATRAGNRSWQSASRHRPARIRAPRHLPDLPDAHGRASHPYYGPGNVIIDTCRNCDLVWLDFGELQQIDEAPGDDRGRPPRIVPPSTRGDAELDDHTA